MLIRGSKMADALNVRSKADVRHRMSRRSKGSIARINNDSGDRDADASRLLIHKVNSNPEKDSGSQTEQNKLEMSPGKLLSESHPKDASESAIPPEISINYNVEEKQQIKVGDRVEAKYRGRGRRYYKGTVAACQPDGLYNINYDDGDKDFDLSVEFIRRLNGTISEKRPNENKTTNEELANDVSVPEPFDDADVVCIFTVGQKVEAKFRNRGRRWYKGTIAGVFPNGLYSVTYDDGDIDTNLPSSAIRTKESLIRSVQDADELKSGGDVTPGRRSELSAEAVKPPETTVKDTMSGEASAESRGCFKKGQMVESRYKGRGRRWYKGKVTKCCPSDTYNIQYTDGDEDFELSGKHIRSLDMPPNASSSKAIEGSKEETAKLHLKDNGNEISLQSSSNTTAELPEHKAVGGVGSKVDESRIRFNKGDRVEAKFHGRGSCWYKGIIAACVPNGTYKVQYDDGDKDSGLPASAIRALPRGLDQSPPEKDAAFPKRSSAGANISTADGDDSFLSQEIMTEKPSAASKKEEDCFMEESPHVEDVISKDIESTGRNANAGGSAAPMQNGNSLQQHHPKTYHSGKGNRLYRGVVSKVKVAYLFEIEYADGTKDVNIPLGALRTKEGVTCADITVGSSVDVLSWQDRFWASNS